MTTEHTDSCNMEEVWFKPPGQDKVLKFSTMKRFTDWKEQIDYLEKCVSGDQDDDTVFYKAVDGLKEFTSEYFMSMLPVTLANRFLDMMMFGNDETAFDVVKLFKCLADACGEDLSVLVGCEKLRKRPLENWRKTEEAERMAMAASAMAPEVVAQAEHDEMLDRCMKVRKLNPGLDSDSVRVFARK